LWLLPSGPDQVGEELVHHQPSGVTYRILALKMQVLGRRITGIHMNMKSLGKTWVLDPRLENDTVLISFNDAWQTRLMNDKRWPWIIVVPIMPDVEDIDDYRRGAHEPLMQHLADISLTLKDLGLCTSTNVASIGNVVKQMHWHVVGRNQGDPNWPAPVWGFETAIPYSKEETVQFISDFKKAFRGTFY